MLLENIALGKTLEVYVDRDGYRYRLVSKVEKTGVKRVCLTAIMAGGRAFKFRPEDNIRLVYRSEDQMWEWLNVKAGLGKLDDEPVHYFEIVNKGQSFNRRQAYRVAIDADVDIVFYQVPGNRQRLSYAPLVKEEYEALVDVNGVELEREEDSRSGKIFIEKRLRMVPMKEAVEKKVRGFVHDISETGMGVYSNELLEKDNSFYTRIPSDYGPLLVRCVVVRVDDQVKGNRKYRYYYGCIYEESDQKLIRYIYDIQRKQIQKQRDRREFESSVREIMKERKK
ncbi:MAG: PilZ domain-containing protein [Roseburia sp.]|nr:PilZ domain-containing protein [Roseburia sp.]